MFGWGYIDHQSNNNENREIFDSEDRLREFMFGNDYIQGGNDNGSY